MKPQYANQYAIAEGQRFALPLRDCVHMGTQFAVYEWSEERVLRWV